MKPNTSTLPLINRMNLEQLYGGYTTPAFYNNIPMTPYVPLDISVPSLQSSSSGGGGGDGDSSYMGLDALRSLKYQGNRTEATSLRRKSDLTDSTGRYPYYTPDYDNEDAYGQNQGWTTKMFNGVTKGIGLAGTTFLQTTVGAVNGTYQWANTGNFTSFYDNDFNRSLDEFNKNLENTLPTYETKKFRDASWHSPDYLFTGNFLWEGIVKNLGFAAGAAGSGMAFSAGIGWAGKLAGVSRLTASGRVAEALTKAGMLVDGSQKANKIKALSDNFLSAYKGLNLAERVTVAGLATTGEAGIEAYHNLNDYRDKAITAFEAEFGRDPNTEELAEINKAAEGIGDSSFVGNMLLLTATNYIQFPKILGSSYKAEKGIFNELAQSTKPLVKEGGKYVAKKATKLGRVGRAITNPYVFSYSEAFEEGAQFAIGIGSEDYYDKKYNNKDFDIWSSVYKGLEKTLNTDEGMKNVLIGGLSGALMLSGVLTFGRTGAIAENRKTNKDTSDALRSSKWDNTGLNSAGLSDFMNDTYDSVVRGASIQEEREGYTQSGDILNSKDAEADYIINYLSPRMKHGRYDLVMADIKDFETQASSEAGWEKLKQEGIVQESDTKEAFLSRLQSFKQTAENVKSLYQSLNVKYKGAINEDGKRLYSDQVIDKMVYAASKIADYNNRYNQLSSEIIDPDINLSEITAAIVNKDDKPLNDALKKIKERENITETEKLDIVEKLTSAAQIAVRRHNFVKEYDAIFENPQKYSEKTRDSIKDVKEGETIKVKTGKNKEKEVVIGKPYYLVESYKPSKDGVRAQRKAHKVQLLKQNEDGSVEIQFANGTVKTVTSEQLSTYNLGSVEATEKNKKAKFVLENLDEEFEHFGVTEKGKNRWGVHKNEPAAKGVLEYDRESDEVLFVWTTPSGKTYTRKVTGQMFKAKEGFAQGMISETGDRLSDANSTARATSKKAFLSMDEKISRRTEVAKGLYESLLSEVTSIANKIQANQNRLDSLDQEIENAYKTKSGQPRKRITKDLLNLVTELEKLKESIPAETERLIDQQVELEGELEYVKSFVDNVDSTESSGKQMINNLKEDMADLEQLINLTKDSITRTEKALPLIEAIYQRALKLLNNFIERIASLNPGLPLSMDTYRENMASRLGDEVAEGIISRREGFTAQILDVENTILSYTELLNYPKHEAKFQEMSNDLKEMKATLTELESNYRAQEKILEAFRDFWKKESANKVKEEVLVNNKKTDNVIDGTLETDGGSADYDPDFIPSPLKSNAKVPTATRGVDFGKEDQKRANEFGFNLPKLQENGKNVQAVYVTSSTEEAIGIPGLMERIAENAAGVVEDWVDQNDIIAVVMVTEGEDGLVLVDVNGDPITEGNPLDSAIWQTMPAGELMQKDGSSMFRVEKEGGPNKETKAEIVKKYKVWRKGVLGRTAIETSFEPQASFGRLQYETDEDGEPIYTLRTPVSSAGFVEDDNTLINKQVLVIPTTETVVSKGTTEFTSKSDEQALYKRVLIEADNGLAQVKNQTVNDNQANVILKAIKVLAQELLEKESLGSVKSLALISYLKGVIYFGIPQTRAGKAKPKATNSVFFKKDVTTGTQWLYIGQEASFEFTPTVLRDSSPEILEALKGLYTNTNAAKVREMGETFEELLDISEEGEITSSRTWPNYQTYLLSKFMPTEEGKRLSTTERPIAEIPLVTSAKPITESEPINRKDIYFYNESLEEETTAEHKENLNFRALKQAKEAQEGVESMPLEEVISFVNDTFPGIEEQLSEIKNQELREEKYRRYFIFYKLKDLYEDSDLYKDLSTEEKQQFLKDKLEEIITLSEKKGNTLHQTLDKINASWFSKFGEAPKAEETRAEEIQETRAEEVAEEVEEEKEPETPPTPPRMRSGRRARGSARIKTNQSILKVEDWKFVENWLKQNFPNIPFYRMENIIRNTNGDAAWGLFKDASIYVYKNAEEGTAFHEVFEAVWAMFSTAEEKVATLKEFKARSGSFFDRPSQTTVAYKDASDFQVKEALAEEFREYVLKKNLPKGNIILRAFKNLIQFIKQLINRVKGTAQIEDLFKKINTGGYRNEIPKGLSKVKRLITNSDESLVVSEFEGDFSTLNTKLTDAEKNDIVNELIYQTIANFLKAGNGLFNFVKVDASDKVLKQHLWSSIETLTAANDDNLFYGSDKNHPWADYSAEDRDRMHDAKKLEIDQLIKNIENEWPIIKQKFGEKIKQFKIQFDENDKAQVENEDKTKNSDYIDGTKVDKLQKMNETLKLVFSTVAKTETILEDGVEYTEEVASSIGGVQTLPFTVVTNTLMKKLHKSVNIMDMIERFRALAEENPDYRTLYYDFIGLKYTEDVNLKGIKTAQDERLISGLWKTFSLAAPEVKNVFILEDGQIEVGDASLSTEAIQLRNTWVNTITLKSKSGTGFFKFSKQNGGIFVINKEKLAKFKLTAGLTQHSLFLAELGIDFSYKEMTKLNEKQQAHLKSITSGMRASLNGLGVLKSFSSKSLDLHKQALLLGLLKASVSNPAFESTYFNVAGERTQTFIGTNATDRLHKILSQIDNISQLEGTEYEYLIFGTDGRNGKDVFTQNSVIIKAMFDETTGDRIEDNGEENSYLTNGYAGGTINTQKGKNTVSSKLKYRDRLLQELNLNLKGWYMNLVPGDSSTEWMSFIGNFVSTKNLATSYKETFRIMKGYFIDEVNLSREEGRDIFVDRDENIDSKRKDLRFFKDILDEATLSKIRRTTKKDPATIYEENKDVIEAAILRYIKGNSTKLNRQLSQFGLIELGIGTDKGKQTITSTSLGMLSEDRFELELDRLSINYMIANIEMHKVLYGDPYQYKDELKRTKSFQSPRQEILNSSNEMNTLMHEIGNENFPEGSVGHTNFIRDYFRTITFSDVKVISELFPAYGVMVETDGGGIIGMKAHRNFKKRASDWTDANEQQFTYEMKYYELYKAGKIEQAKALKNPKVRDTFTAIKPVVTGNRKHYGGNNKIVLDKYSLYPMSFRMMVEMGATNGMKLYDKMHNEDIDYVIFNSGRKVGAYNSVAPYNEKGEFVSEPFKAEEVINVPFYAMGLQTEVPSKDKNLIIRGSQVTKIITMDRMDAGMPLDFMENDSFSKRYRAWNAIATEEAKEDASELYKEIKNNRRLLEALTDFGYKDLLERLGIKEIKDKKGKVSEWKISDFDRTSQLIKDEVLLRDTNDNIVAALNRFMEGSSVLEATPAYRQISNILYSIVDDNIASPKINGQMKVQIPSTFWEENRVEISEINGKKGYTSDALGFYSEVVDKDGKRTKVNVMEIYVGRWFKSDMNDEQLLEFLNNTEEGQKILEGFAFRIPTQNMNSIDAFRINKFLPEEFGDNVVVPSAIVGKVGSDFDIDKLSIYLKNVFRAWNGKPVLVPNFGIGEVSLQSATEYAKEDLKKQLARAEIKLESTSRLQRVFGDMALGLTNEKTMSKWIPIFKNMYSDYLNEDGSFPVYFIENKFMQITERTGKKIENLTNEDWFNNESQELGKKLYKAGLENAYIESNINLLVHPTNYEKLTSPNDASLLSDLSDEMVKARGEEVINYKTPVNMLDRTFMTALRHDFVAGKQGIGIAAVGQTNNYINQTLEVTVDANKLKNIPKEDTDYLGDATIRFAPSKYNFIVKDGKNVPTLSMRKSKGGNYISDILGMIVDGFVDISNGPWIMRLGATPEVISTWIFLLKVGVPIKDIAYFMNQPIIREYIQMIQNKGYSWLFINTYVEELKEKYASNYTGKINEIPSVSVLKTTINKKGELRSDEKAEQIFYLDEFLKYSMMGRHLFYFVQGTNYDTASFNNPYLLSKKAKQFEVAQQSIISDANEVLKTSFIGNLRQRLLDAREALKEILISDKLNTRAVVEKALLPYTHINDRDYVKMAERIITNLFDWAVQTHTSLNIDLQRLLIDDKNIAQQMSAYVKEVKKDVYHPLYNNYLIENIEILPSKSAEPGSPDNIKVKPPSNEVYEQNRMISAFRELREELGKDSELYQGLVKVAILQSGLSPSTISFTSYIPFEDFEPFYNEALSILEERVDLREFNNTHIFQRNNWHNGDIIEYKRAEYIEALNQYNPGMGYFRPPNVNKAVENKDVGEILQLRVGVETRSDFIVYTWEDYIVLTSEEQKQAYSRGGKEAIRVANSKKKQEMKDAGDYSFLHKALMKKVFKPNGEPYVYEYTAKVSGNTSYSHVYRAINAWGMGNRANEYYSIERPSVINNGFDEVEYEGTDADVLDLYFKTGGKKTSARPLGIEKLTFTGNNPQKVIANVKTTTIRNYLIPDGTYDVDGVAVKLKQRGYLTIQEAGGIEAISKSEDFGPDGPLFPNTKEWLKGKGKLYVYDLEAPQKRAKSGGSSSAVLNVSVKGGNFIVNNKTFPLSFANANQLLSLGYTLEQANKIIEEVNDPLKGCE